ncbi:TAP-like protein-domain-containing protein [Xylariaceae sp. FL0804]|nr:TAP-like protein-domain-containing protein [Xylariaceae sp. FL0804]
MPNLHRAAGALAAFAALSAASPLGASSVHARSSTHSTAGISWGPCPEGYGFSTNLTCATYNAPIDWNNPGGNETVELGMVRLEASDKAKRIGYLFTNPGGPGGKASALVNELAENFAQLDPATLDRFDIIGLDPRGVGLSTPVRCDPAIVNERVSFFPTSQGEFKNFVQHSTAFWNSCRRETGRLIDFVDTISAAKDHEAVRRALGGQKATFLGFSYGTQLFSQYAQLFPQGIRAMVLDGNVQHSQAEPSNLLIESTTYEATLKQFFSWCDSSEDCPLDGENTEAKFISVIATADQTPIPAPGCDGVTCQSDVTGEDILFTLQGILATVADWPVLGQALLEATNGNATLLSQSKGLATGDPYADGTMTAGFAVACQDWTHAARTLADFQAKAAEGRVFAPLTRGASQTYQIQTLCVGWGAPLTNPPRPATPYRGAAPLLMVNSLYDPETSYAWALGLREELDNAVLVTRNGSGHTSYLLGGETTALMNEYLVNLTLPVAGTVTQS